MGIFNYFSCEEKDYRLRIKRQKEQLNNALFGENAEIRIEAIKKFTEGDTSSAGFFKMFPNICPYLDKRKSCKAASEELDTLLQAYGDLKLKNDGRDLDFCYYALIEANNEIEVGIRVSTAIELGCMKSASAATVLLEAKKRESNQDVLAAINWGIKLIGKAASENGLISVLTQGIKDRL